MFDDLLTRLAFANLLILIAAADLWLMVFLARRLARILRHFRLRLAGLRITDEQIRDLLQADDHMSPVRAQLRLFGYTGGKAYERVEAIWSQVRVKPKKSPHVTTVTAELLAVPPDQWHPT